MPNWTANNLYVKCATKEQSKEVISRVKGETDAFDFNRIIPMPPSLGIETSSATEQDMLAYCKANNLKCPLKITPWGSRKPNLERGKTAYENIVNYGHMSWYDWCCENWGTKWNASDSSVDVYDLTEPCIVHAYFQTAWCAPLPVIAALSRMFPDAEITIDSQYEGGETPTRYVFLNGEVVFSGEWEIEIVDEEKGDKFDSWDDVPEDHEGWLTERMAPEKTEWYGKPESGFCADA